MIATLTQTAEAMSASWAERTFKRELAVAALVFWAALTAKLFWGASPELIGALSTAYGTASTSIWLFAAAAFGVDAWVKQVVQRPAGAAA